MVVNLTLHTDPPPLRADESGAIRVGSSRVSLDVIIADYANGKTPKDIVGEYETLNLADVHAAIAYYLRYRDEVDDYLKQRQEEADSLRESIQKGQPPFPTKDDLLERQREKHA
jgi:uncharacterized protein (DUF433 family)